MPSEKIRKLIESGRDFLRFDGVEDDHELSDQQLRLPQPPLVKDRSSDVVVDLPNNFNDLPLKNDILAVINDRVSHRVYTDESMSLLELSFLLWSTQGVKSIRGNNYATLRTVPCGGARHEFETYLAVRNIEGLKKGSYHYLPLTHQLEYLGEILEIEKTIGNALSDQRWAASANVVFFWSVVPYRAEWRYSYFAHRIILVDIGYVSQNLYIACEAVGLGTCAVGAFERIDCDKIFNLDGEDEFIVLASPVGTVSPKNKDKEDAFYAFLKQEQK
ncbi:MAG: SagB/ThcOx family dehydrogenase [Bacilli bacterium]|nr:SagB/ThcOx family dehydrogenase [Bacilli bacterium]MBN2696322.1 SagB/ThcOx family dehydrogenase [Bacilli bacterium]